MAKLCVHYPERAPDYQHATAAFDNAIKSMAKLLGCDVIWNPKVTDAVELKEKQDAVVLCLDQNQYENNSLFIKWLSKIQQWRADGHKVLFFVYSPSKAAGGNQLYKNSGADMEFSYPVTEVLDAEQGQNKLYADIGNRISFNELGTFC